MEDHMADAALPQSVRHCRRAIPCMSAKAASRERASRAREDARPASVNHAQEEDTGAVASVGGGLCGGQLIAWRHFPWSVDLECW